MVVDKLLSFVLTTIAGPIQDDTYAILWMISGCLLFSCVCAIFIKGEGAFTIRVIPAL